MGTVRHITRRFVSPLLVILAVSGAWPPGPAQADGIDPQNFDVQIDGIGPGPDDMGVPECVQGVGGQDCTESFDFSVRDQEASGTVTEQTTALSGTIGVVCDFAQHMDMTFFIPDDPAVTPTGSVSGSGSQGCSWHMEFDDGSTLTGTIVGQMEMGMVDGVSSPTVYFGGDFSVTVVSGSGAFEGTVGTGTFSEYAEMPLFEGPSVRAIRELVAEGGGSSLAVQLETGRYKAVVLSPSGTIRRSSTQPLQVVSVAGKTCTVTASASDGSTVKLGSLGDADGDGLYQLRGLAGHIGRTGSWTVKAACPYQLSGTKYVARGSARIKVTK